MCDGVTNRLRASRQLGRTVTLRLRYGDFTSATRSYTVSEATDSTKIIHDTARQLLHNVWPELEKRGCTKVGIAVSNLCPDSAVQLALPFGKADHARLDRAVDDARRRFGYHAIGRARLTGSAGDRVRQGHGYPHALPTGGDRKGSRASRPTSR